MKVITAVIKPEKFDDLMHAITEAGARGLTVTDVRGFGQQYGHMSVVKDAQQRALVLPKLRVDILVNDDCTDRVTDAIVKSVSTGAIGDGKIWICPASAALRVRTGERDEDAI